MFTDADLEMAELAEQGNMIAAGICPICTDVLDPMHPKWAKHVWPRTRMRDGTYRDTTREEYATMLGPIDHQLGEHIYCQEDRL